MLFFSLGFEKEKVGWLLEHLGKATEMVCFLGFNKKYKGKTNVHPMKVRINPSDSFIMLFDFASNKKTTLSWQY